MVRSPTFFPSSLCVHCHCSGNAHDYGGGSLLPLPLPTFPAGPYLLVSECRLYRWRVYRDLRSWPRRDINVFFFRASTCSTPARCAPSTRRQCGLEDHAINASPALPLLFLVSSFRDSRALDGRRAAGSHVYWEHPVPGVEICSRWDSRVQERDGDDAIPVRARCS
ncbi:hypothetical protein DFH07DRAFT_384028 [Mycena maculata]|uniref:Uncharacterized protein n=1 Tax=Mycena maculata TaxID=230809 RepID=A0AAD7JFU7_9AGAR|nr:hypothetical protein DFH07DRAFT_384028 [Mycena maculata]